MPYYKIPKKTLQQFYQDNIAPNEFTPFKIISPNEFEIMTSYFLHNSKHFEEIQNLYNNSVINIDNLKHTASIKDYFKQNKNIVQNTDNILEAYLQNKSKNNHYLNNDVAIYTLLKHLPNEKKYDNFKSIVNYSTIPHQSSIIDIDFGTEQVIEINPIKNTDGLNQSYATFYNPNITDIIIHSQNSLETIQLSLGITPTLATEDEVSTILNSTTNIIDLHYLANPDEFLNKNMSTFNSKTIDSFEDFQNKIKDTDNPINFEEFFPLFTKNIEKYCSDDTLHSSHYQIITHIEKQLLSYSPKEIIPAYVDYIKTQFKIINDNTFSNLVLKMLSPNSSLIGKALNSKIGTALNDELSQHLNPVENAYLYSHFLYPSFSKSQSFNEVKLSINESGSSKKTKKEQIKLIEEGYSLTLRDFSHLGPYGQKSIAKLLDKVSHQDSDTYEQFNHSAFFRKIQKDIYPLLEFKDKLNYVNYECFIQDGIHGNQFLHVNSLPKALWEDSVLKDIIKAYIDNDSLQLSFGPIDDMKEKYFIPSIVNIFSDSLEDANHNKDFIYLAELKEIIYHKQFKGSFLQTLSEHPSKEKIIHNLLEQYLQFSGEPEISQLLEHLVPVMLINNKKVSSQYFKTLETIYSLLPEIFEKNIDHSSGHPFLEFIATNPNFDTNNSKTQEFILKIYQNNNNCVTKHSPTSLTKLFQEPSFLNKIINLHKQGKTISYCKGFNIQEGFKNEHFSDSLISKANSKKISSFDFDLAYLSPSLLDLLPVDSLKDKQKWINTLQTYLNLGKAHNIVLPKEISHNYEIFDSTLSHYLEVLKVPFKNSKDQDDIIKQSQVLNQFSKIFIYREAQIVKLLDFFSENYSVNKNINVYLKYALEKINPDICATISQIESQKPTQGANPFDEAIIGLRNVAMSKKIFQNINTNPHQVKKF